MLDVENALEVIDRQGEMFKKNGEPRLSKIDRYNWKIDNGTTCSFELVKKNKLMVDHSYQRNPMDQRVLKIARDFDWVKFGALSVAKRGGLYYITDGQHRWLASKKRPDIGEFVPCLIFSSTTATDEARHFIAQNDARRALSYFEKMNAGILAGDKLFVKLHDIFTMLGIEATKHKSGPYTCSCLAICIKILKLKGDDVLFESLELALRITPEKPIDSKLIEGLAYILKNEMPQNFKSKFIEACIKAGGERINEGIVQSKMYHGNAAEKACAQGVLNAINKKRKYKFHISNIESSKGFAPIKQTASSE